MIKSEIKRPQYTVIFNQGLGNIILPEIQLVMCRFGGYSEGDTHDPIPNSTVKPLRAYDTLS